MGRRKKTRPYGLGRIEKRGRRWYAVLHGKRHATGSLNRQDAIDLLAKLHRQQADSLAAGERGITVGELLGDYLKRKDELAPGTRATYESQSERHLLPFFGSIPLIRITTDLLTDYREKREKQDVAQGTNAKQKRRHRKVGQTSINRELALLRAAMRDLAKRRPKLLSYIPYFPMHSEDGNVRQGFIRDEDFESKLLPALPRHLKAISTCAFFAGARRGEWTGVKVTDVNLKTLTMYLLDTKNGEPREVPIFNGLMEEQLGAELAYHELVCPDEPYLFTYDGRRLQTFRKAWARACRAAGFPAFHFHDLRRSANMGLRDAGVPQTVRMKITGHKTDSQDRRYGIVDKENLDIAREKRGMGRATTMGLRRVK